MKIQYDTIHDKKNNIWYARTRDPQLVVYGESRQQAIRNLKDALITVARANKTANPVMSALTAAV